MYFLVVVVILLVCLWRFHASNKYRRDCVRNIPGPYAFPILGSLGMIFEMNPRSKYDLSSSTTYIVVNIQHCYPHSSYIHQSSRIIWEIWNHIESLGLKSTVRCERRYWIKWTVTFKYRPYFQIGCIFVVTWLAGRWSPNEWWQEMAFQT